MSSVYRWRDSGHLDRAVETAGSQEAFDDAVASMLNGYRGYQLILVGLTKASWRRWSSWPVKALKGPSL